MTGNTCRRWPAADLLNVVVILESYNHIIGIVGCDHSGYA